jgi:hypothetical protein
MLKDLGLHVTVGAYNKSGNINIQYKYKETEGTNRMSDGVCSKRTPTTYKAKCYLTNLCC